MFLIDKVSWNLSHACMLTALQCDFAAQELESLSLSFEYRLVSVLSFNKQALKIVNKAKA